MSATNEALTKEFAKLSRKNDELTEQIEHASEERAKVRSRMQAISQQLVSGIATAREIEVGRGHRILDAFRANPAGEFDAPSLARMNIGSAREISPFLAYYAKQGVLARVSRGRYRLATSPASPAV